MKKIIVVLFLLSIISCKKRTRPTENSNLKIKMNTLCNGTQISLGLMNKVNAAGNTYSINLLKYYLSNMVITSETGETIAFNNYELIDVSDPASSWLSVPTLPYGKYTKLKISLGVDYFRNHEGAQDGDLDPVNGMIWNWNTGYIFYKHEGMYKVNDTLNQGVILHMGTDRAYNSVEIPINWKVDSSSQALYINFDINSMYNNPVIDFNVDNNRQSTSINDGEWLDNMKNNVGDAFTYDHTE